MTLTDRQASIEYILEKGLITRETVWERARLILRRMGLRLVFWDTAYSLVFLILTLGTAAAVAWLAPSGWSRTLTVACSPAVFVIIVTVTELVERFDGLYGLRQTCHFTSRQVTAVRVMCYSAVGAVAAGLIAWLSADTWRDFLSLLPLGLGALFFSAVTNLFLLAARRPVWLTALVAAGWLAVVAGPPAALGPLWENFLASLSTAVTSLVCLIGAVILLWQIARLLTERRPYVVA